MKEVMLSNLTLRDVREYLKTKNTLIIPIGSTEQHGEHLLFTTDADIPTEIARRTAQRIGALVAPPVYYGLSGAHSGFPGSAWLRGTTLLHVIEDISVSFAKSGFKRIVWINGHYCNESVLYVACSDITGTKKVPEDTKVYGFSYFVTMPEEVEKKYVGEGVDKALWHANIGETSAMLAIKPDAVKMEYALPRSKWVSPGLAKKSAVALNCVTAATGCWKHITKTGVWGDARKATKEKGEEFLREITDAVVKLIEEVESSFQEMEKKD